MKESLYKKILLYGIVFLFIGAAIVPSISGDIDKTSIQSTIEVPTIFPLNADYVNAYWKFDECSGDTLHDSSGNNYHGTIYDASWTTGQSGCALDFDGVNDYVALDPYSADLGFNKTDDVIFTVYFKSTSTHSGMIYCNAGYEHVPEARIELLANGTVIVKIFTMVCGLNVTTENSFNDGDWHNVTVFFNGITSNPTLSVFVDGELEGSLTDWLCPIVNSDFTKAKIGRRGYENEGYFEGSIDEFKIIKYPGGNKQNRPTIDGPESGEPSVEYEYTFVTEDPEGDNIWLHIDWDDGTIEKFGPFPSGKEVKVSHKWDVDDKYEIKAKSEDIWHESPNSKYVVRIGNQPPEAPEITGPLYGDPGQDLTYTFIAEDYEGQNIKYKIDWDDGTTSETNYYPSNTAIEVSHSWGTKDDYNITARAIDIKDKEGDSSGYHIRIGDQPPDKPKIYGAVQGLPDIIYNYGFVSIDLENDNITYEIDWGDDNIETDIGPLPSGEIFPRSHSWNESDTFIIKARAKDDFGYYSDWSEHKIIIPRNKAFNLNLLELLFERFPRVFLTFRHLLGKLNIILFRNL